MPFAPKGMPIHRGIHEGTFYIHPSSKTRLFKDHQLDRRRTSMTLSSMIRSLGQVLPSA